jgi:hypothetical protein
VGDLFRKNLALKFSDIIKAREAEVRNIDGLNQNEFYLFCQYYRKMKEEQDRLVNVDDKERPSPIRFRKMYLQDNDVNNKTFPGCNSEEIKLMEERHALAEWIKSDEVIKVFLDALDEKGEELFNQTFLNIVVAKGGTKDISVPGSRDDNAQMKDVLRS